MSLLLCQAGSLPLEPPGKPLHCSSDSQIFISSSDTSLLISLGTRHSLQASLTQHTLPTTHCFQKSERPRVLIHAGVLRAEVGSERLGQTPRQVPGKVAFQSKEQSKQLIPGMS